jgi:tripartite-type tricarboxylate transporter receptor subunit TctC
MAHVSRRTALLAALALGLPAAGGRGAMAADGYPAKPVRLIISYPPGGTSDLVARVVAQDFTARFGQSFVVDNRPGAGGQIGTDIAAKAKPDGYTLYAAASGPIIFLPALSRDLPYDVFRDFEMIGNIVTVPNIMIVRPTSPFTSLAEFVAAAKANPGRIHFGSAGVGASGHLAGELLKELTGTDMQHVPYRGSGPALTDLMGGQIDVMFENLPSALSHVREGTLRAVALLSKSRSPSAPDIPTTAELGYPDFLIDSSTALLAPKGTPEPVLATIGTALRDFTQDPTSQAKLASLGADLDYMDAAAFRSYVQREIDRWSAVARHANIKLEQ